MNIMLYTKKQPTLFKTIVASYLTWKKSLLMTVPFGLVHLIASYILIPDFVYKQINDHEFLNNFSLILVSRIILNFIIISVTHVSTVYIINKIAHNESPYWIQAIKLGFKKCLAILVILVLNIAILMIFIPILLFILKVFPYIFLYNNKLSLYLCFLLAFTPGAIIAVYFMPTIYLLVIDGNSIISSVKNSFYLVSGRWWYVFGVFLIITGICQGYTSLLGNHNSSVDCFLTSFPFTLFILPFIHTFIVTLLNNLKAKKSI